MTLALLMSASFFMKVAMTVFFAASIVAVVGNVGYTQQDCGTTHGSPVSCRYVGAGMPMLTWMCFPPPKRELTANVFWMA